MIEKIRDILLILAALVMLWINLSNWVVGTFIEKAQLAQQVQALQKQLEEGKKK